MRGGLAAGLTLTLAATMSATPSYAQVTPGQEPSDVASALAAARKTGERVRIDAATTETAEYFATPDGTVTGVISASTERFRRDGAWVPVDLTLKRRADGSIAPAAAPGPLRLSGARTASTDDLVSGGSGGRQVTVGWAGALPEPRLEGNKATYAEVKPGIDLVVQATVNGFEQFTVVKSAQAAEHVGEIVLPLTGPGVASVSEDKRGRLRVRGADGRPQAKIPTPMMWDAGSAVRGEAPQRRQVSADVVKTAGAGSTTLSLKPDKAWLTSPDTVYPVTIDPYFDWSTTAYSTTVVTGYPTGWPDADSLFVGSYNADIKARSFITWWANALPGLRIDSAIAHFANAYSTSCSATPWEIWTTDPVTDETSWDNQPEWQTLESTSTATSCTGDWVTADATSFFQGAADKNVETPTMGIRAADESDYSQYKQFWSHNHTDTSKAPYVEVTYSEPTPDGEIDAATQAEMDRQAALEPALTKIMEARFEDPDSGFAGVAYEGSGLSVYYKGALEPEMQTAVTEARTLGTVSLKSAAYSEAELNSAGDGIWTAIDQLGGSSEIQQITYHTEGDAITVVRDPLVTQSLTPAQIAAGGTPATVEQVLAKANVQVPVKIESVPGTGVESTAARYDRFNDYAPFNGGGAWTSFVGTSSTKRSLCSLGFGVRSEGIDYIVSAGHCANTGDMTRSGDYSRSTSTHKDIGKVVSKLKSYDLLLIRGKGSAVLWSGSSLTSGTVRNIDSWGYWAKNQQVCRTGIRTALVCNLKQEASADLRAEDGSIVKGLIRARQLDGKTASVKGDSGGTVWSTDGSGARIRGTVTGVDASRPSHLYFQDMADVRNRLVGTSMRVVGD
ncbi:hypothetical protein ACTI_67060 [Actinoplanes sp. OR16]|nr:hypothetical protein ACTI_67060 [Actinoplanes sp. OR16]